MAPILTAAESAQLETILAAIQKRRPAGRGRDPQVQRHFALEDAIAGAMGVSCGSGTAGGMLADAAKSYRASF